jgi:mannose/cellobiose epimerase-like protein (N-acyl-D-glucosamine 2-epimerase family)
MSLPELRQSLCDELFQVYLPFWDKHGIDHQNGGVMCSLDYDGTRVSTEKSLWFQGRAIWVYSFLYSHFGQDPRHLEVARKTKEFLFKHALQKDGWWAEVLSQEGKVLKPFSGDTEGMYFVAEGLQEYAAATSDEPSREAALSLLKKLFRSFNSPDFRYRGADFQYLWNSERAVQPQGLWFLNLNIATQILKRWSDPEISAMVDAGVEAILHKHYHPEIGLNTEMLYFGFSRPKEEERKVRFGHSIEALWMLMDEATRRRDAALWETCAERIRRHLDAGWDHVYGGLIQWVNVDQVCYQWPPETPPGTDLELHFAGEYEYLKTLWGLNEVMIATLKVFERTRAEWAARYFGMAYQLIKEKFSQKSRGYPGGYMLFADRRMAPQPHVARQDNYHPPRQLMLNILTLDGMLRHDGSQQIAQSSV